MTDAKLCSTCGQEKPRSEFYADKRTKNRSADGLNYACKECCREYARNRYRSDPVYRLAANASRFRRQYGITIDEYSEMLASQGGVCAVCAGESSNGRALSVDHNHVTGVVRALLCDNCNRALGLIRDDPEVARALADYLEKYA